ncbi:MAG: DUF2306 domain-containing protein [Saprospiraceae bacterium]|nr:DUF2306 domain-containing protein [Saprospiraceae bacterium]
MSIIWLLAILLFSFQFIQIIAPYATWQRDVDFLLTKQHIIHLDYYRVAFYAHIFSSIFVLASGAFLFPKYILQKWPKLHRYAGRIYVRTLLLVSAPSGFVMAFHANGGWAAQASFLLLTPLWWWFTWKGLDTARKRQFTAHKNWMLRSYALTLSAVSLRVYQLLLGSFFALDPVTQYVLISWAAWVGNLLAAEGIIWWQMRRVFTLSQAPPQPSSGKKPLHLAWSSIFSNRTGPVPLRLR